MAKGNFMKNMLRSTAAWLNEKVTAKRAPALVPVEDTPKESPVAPSPVEFKAPVLPMPAPAPVETPAPPPQHEARLALTLKGSTFYATCPHCESTFNLQQRLVDPRFKRLFATTGMTCPKCEKGVAMPTQEDLRAVKRG
jgi:hypothetical protein